MNPLFGIVFVLFFLGGLMVALACFQKKRDPAPELVRKLLHVGMGLMTLSFPWVFTEPWPVMVLASLAVFALLLIRFIKIESLNQVIHSVARDSFGELYFPISIAIIFSLSQGNTILFIIPVLILTLADATAALIGVHYGKVKYTTVDGHKSIEGSIAFFTVAFLSSLIPLLLFTQVGRAEILLIALIIATLVMYVEAMSWQGLDNLFIPLAGFLLLKVYMNMEVSELALRLGVIVVLFVFLVLYRKRTTLNDGAMLAAGFAGYLAWSAGGWSWFVPALLVLVTYHLLSPKTQDNTERIHDARAVLAVSMPAMIWLFIARDEQTAGLYYSYSVSFAAQLGMIALARLNCQNPGLTKIVLWVRCAIQGSLIIFIPWLFIMGVNLYNIAYASVGVCLVAVAVSGFYYLQPRMDDCPTDSLRFWRQGGIGFLVSVLAYLVF